MASAVAGLLTALEADTKALLANRSGPNLAYVCDGARELWDLLEDRVDEDQLGVEALNLLDFWHVTEKLASALRVIGDQPSLARCEIPAAESRRCRLHHPQQASQVWEAQGARPHEPTCTWGDYSGDRLQ